MKKPRPKEIPAFYEGRYSEREQLIVNAFLKHKNKFKLAISMWGTLTTRKI